MANEQVDTEGDAGAFLAVVRRRAWIVILAVVAAVGFAYVFTSLQEKQYKSTATLLFRQVLLDVQLTGVPLVAPTNDATVESATNVELVSQENVRVAAASRLGPGYTATGLEDVLEIEPQKKSDLVGIEATASTPEEAAEIANAVAASYLEIANEQAVSRINAAADRVRTTISSRRMSDSQRRELRSQLIKLNVLAALGPQTVQLSQPAVPPRKQASPKPLLNLLIGGAVGLIVGLALAFGVEHFDRRLRSAKELEREAGLPLLATVPGSKRLRTPRDGAWPAEAEPFRQLVNQLLHRSDGRDVGSVLVVAPGPGSGASTVALYLGLAAAEASADGALLVEANLRRPVLGTVLGLPGDGGLSSLRPDDPSPDPEVHAVPVGNGGGRELSVVLAGEAAENPGGVLASDAVGEVLRAGREEYGFTVVDGTSPLVVADVLPLLSDVDAVLLVGRLGKDTGQDLRRLRLELERQGIEPVGVVANDGPKQKNPYAA